ncbi:MAG: exodeoxyribonuclease VII small subunit [Defluviitaleaceae bacterium]|nr:exodeoxyribonuclease VII small subunit [Defluviitaleaceae bacterium]
MPKKQKSFEAALNELRNIVDTMEKGDLPLSQAVEIYKSGIELSVYCGEYLSKVEDEVTILRASDKMED